jgi:outer membrane biosynthesis protein TonB
MSRGRIHDLALLLAVTAVVGCAKRAAAPVDAGGPEPPAPVAPLRDAGVEHPRDAQADLAPEGPPHRRARHATAVRPEPAGGFKVEGQIGRAEAEAVLRGARPKLDACYTQARAQAPDLKGRVMFRLSVDGRGRVPLAEVVSSTLGGGDPELCMVEALRDLKFPPAPGGGESTLTFPMTFGR